MNRPVVENAMIVSLLLRCIGLHACFLIRIHFIRILRLNILRISKAGLAGNVKNTEQPRSWLCVNKGANSQTEISKGS